jgi:hypothetical protein
VGEDNSGGDPYMIEHVVNFKLKPGVTAEQEAHFLTLLWEMKKTIPTVVDLSAGRNFSDRGQGYNIGLRVSLNDREGLAVYANHAGHQPVKDYVKEIADSVMVMDFEY